MPQIWRIPFIKSAVNPLRYEVCVKQKTQAGWKFSPSDAAVSQVIGSPEENRMEEERHAQ